MRVMNFVKLFASRSAGALAIGATSMLSAPIVTPLHAQQIQGLVVLGAAKRAIPGATLILLNNKHEPVDTSQADVFGSFTLQAPKEGRYFILVRRSGYYPIVSERIELRDSETRNDTLFLQGDDAELSFRQLFAKDLTRLFGSSISAGFSRVILPEQMDELRDRSIHLGDVVRGGHLAGLSYYSQYGCLRFSGEPGCAQIYINGLPVPLRAEQVSSSDIEAVMAIRPSELGYVSTSNPFRDNSRFGVVMVYTSRYASH